VIIYFTECLESSLLLQGAVIFGYEVSDPRSYGVIEFDSDNNIVSVIEKNPLNQKAIMRYLAYIFMIRKWLNMLKHLSHLKEAKLK
jgi:glucose-1-phosphate thymidylyltransferase